MACAARLGGAALHAHGADERPPGRRAAGRHVVNLDCAAILVHHLLRPVQLLLCLGCQLLRNPVQPSPISAATVAASCAGAGPPVGAPAPAASIPGLAPGQRPVNLSIRTITSARYELNPLGPSAGDVDAGGRKRSPWAGNLLLLALSAAAAATVPTKAAAGALQGMDHCWLPGRCLLSTKLQWRVPHSVHVHHRPRRLVHLAQPHALHPGLRHPDRSESAAADDVSDGADATVSIAAAAAEAAASGTGGPVAAAVASAVASAAKPSPAPPPSPSPQPPSGPSACQSASPTATASPPPSSCRAGCLSVASQSPPPPPTTAAANRISPPVHGLSTTAANQHELDLAPPHPSVLSTTAANQHELDLAPPHPSVLNASAAAAAASFLAAAAVARSPSSRRRGHRH